MSPRCDFCGESVNKLKQQVSVMRKEIKNLRQMLDSAVRAHRKHLASVHAAVSKIGVCERNKYQTPSQPLKYSPLVDLQQGNIQTVPIGYVSSCFSTKNGTPRQPTICGPSRAQLRIQQSVFNNPEHALVGLEQYSHVWIIFIFHKNGHLSYKAKVKPPRLNGQRVGVYSTRSPHRPNALGLTLAKLDRIEGDTIHLSDIDMIAGTPVLDIKPYIPEYDSPDTRINMDKEPQDQNTDKENTKMLQLPDDLQLTGRDKDSETQFNVMYERINNNDIDDDDNDDDAGCSSSKDASRTLTSVSNSRSSLPNDLHNVLEEVKAYVTQDDFCSTSCESKKEVSDSCKSKPPVMMDSLCFGEETYTTIADWIRNPPVVNLDVRFTPHAESQLAEFLPTHISGPSKDDRPRFKFLRSSEEAVAAIRGVLSADPRSVYRRTQCKDRLFFFTLDTADITCWFGQGFAEVVQVRPVESL